MTRGRAAEQVLGVMPDAHDNNRFLTWNRLAGAICRTVTS